MDLYEEMQGYEKQMRSILNKMNILCSGNPKENGEKRALCYIKRHLPGNNQKKVNIFDIGANIGIYSELLYNIFGEDANIYSFEPSKVVYNQLRLKNIKNVEAYNIGFSNYVGEADLYVNRGISSLSSLYKRRLDHFNIVLNESEKIKIDTVDNFCKNNNISDIFFLKMDVEGNELRVLEGSIEKIKNNKIQYIQFEFGGCNIDSRTFFQDFWYFLKDNYRIYRITVEGLYEIKEYKELYEIFMLTNFLAEKR